MLVLTICVVLLAVLQLVCILALMDQYKGLVQIRAHLGMVDRPRTVELSEQATRLRPSMAGLPEHLDREDHLVVVFLSTRCFTCKTIARGLRGSLPRGMWGVVVGASREACEQWASSVGLSMERITPDAGRGIAEAYGLDVFPAAVVFERGVASQAQSLPSLRQLLRLKAPAARSLASIPS